MYLDYPSISPSSFTATICYIGIKDITMLPALGPRVLGQKGIRAIAVHSGTGLDVVPDIKGSFPVICFWVIRWHYLRFVLWVVCAAAVRLYWEIYDWDSYN